MNQTDNFALSGGGYCIYAPLSPRFQLTPGFADPVHIFSAELPRMYVLSVLEDGIPMRLTCAGIKFDKGMAVVSYTTTRQVKLVERRFVTTDDRFVVHLELQNTSKNERNVTVVMWTTTDPEGEAVSLEGDSFRVRRSLGPADAPAVPVEIVWSSPSSKGARCMQPFFGEDGSDRPDYEETPWYDMRALPTPRAKRPMEKPSPILSTARVYCGLFREVKLKGNSKQEHRFEANVIFKGKGINFRPRRPDPKDESTFDAFMDSVPKFQSEWKELERVVHQRFEMLRLLRMPHGAGKMSSPAIAEGPGPYHQPIAFSAPALIREARWLKDPTLARGVIKVFFENIKQNGQVPGRLHMTDLPVTDFYHADWGGAFEALDNSHNDKATKRAVLMAMQRYVKWLANNRDPEGSGLTDIVNHFESGQELSRRYTVIDDKADRAEEFSEQFRLKGIDASIFRYRLVKYLIKVADEMQEKAMANRFIAEEEVIREVIKKRLWDDKAGIYMDLDPKSRRRTGVKAAVGFYPLATDIPTPGQVEKMLALLGDRKEFWAKYPVPSLAMTDPWFDANGHWKGTRRGAVWNGRVWPVVNSHVMEGLTYVAERGNKKGQRLLGELMKRTIAMLSGEIEGQEVASSFEHYHPETGLPSRFRCIGMHGGSFILDNVFRVACGLAVRYGEIQDDPVMADMPDFKLQGMPLGNKLFNIERKGGKLKINPV